MSNSLDVLTNNVFSQNMEKMKEVGKEYFTLKRLPVKVGEIKTITLKEMYDKKLLLELTDKDGNSCSADNSYVSVEKFDDEYQMKVYLECGKKSDYIVVIMGCYDYCDTDICEVKKEEINIKIITNFEISPVLGLTIPSSSSTSTIGGLTLSSSSSSGGLEVTPVLFTLIV